jgi:hypothetical protein
LQTVRDQMTDCPSGGDGLSDLEGCPVCGTSIIQKCFCVDLSCLRTVGPWGTDCSWIGRGSPLSTPATPPMMVLIGVSFYRFLGVPKGHTK